MGKDKRNLIFLGIFAVFFGTLFLTGEPVYTGDTFQYENQMVMREPGYALLIQLLRLISPEGHYRLLTALQCVAAIAANTVVIAFFRRRFDMNLPFSFLSAAVLLAPHIMTPVFASTHLVLTNALMTEGILISLYPLAVVSLLDMMWSGKPVGRESIRTIGLFFLLSLIRGQMMVLFVVWLLVAFVMAVRNAMQKTDRAMDRRDTFKLAENILKEGLIAALAIIIIAFAARTVVIRTYNYCEQGLFVDTASGKAMSFANVLYVADREDGAAIADDALRDLFYEMYDSADADQMNYKYAPSGILDKAAHHEKCHDELNFTYFAEPAKRYVGDSQGIYTDRYQELMIAIDRIAEQLGKQLMPEVAVRYFVNYINVAALGFVRTVAYENAFLSWYALFIYMAAVALTVWLWRKKKGNMAASFMAVVLLTIVGNVCATALMIQCISRYMIYNLPLFYMAGMLELRELLRRS
ncbi:MAG: hypothetical protein K2N73_09885 [Lachnospiraceae bacterium]|nr:hypothetical protein [Lachnospiraceae bacterium]